jgi:hypothetical protein
MKNIDEFCHKYQAQVGQSTKMWTRRQSVPYDVWLADPNVFKSIPCQDVPMVEITMPEDRFRALMEHDRWVERAGVTGYGHFNNNVMRVSNMVVDHERECRLRAEHPSLQKAWEQYQIMLRMVDDGQN